MRKYAAVSIARWCVNPQQVSPGMQIAQLCVPDSVVGTRRVLHEAAGCNLPRWNPRLLLSKLLPVLHEPRASNASLSLRCKGGKGEKETFPLPEGRLEPATLGVLACIS